MSDVVMLEAALFQLRNGAEGLSELDLFFSVLTNAVAGARDGVNAARVNDIEFALNDLAAAIDELPAADYERLAELLQMMRDDVARLKQETSLPREVVDGIRALQTKLRARGAAIERQTYRETAEPLPHSPEELRAEALPLRERLAAAGFATPALDMLIDDPSSLRFHSIGEIVDELDVITG
jgi:outer membrane murein-binding lipoprotein Lpp